MKKKFKPARRRSILKRKTRIDCQASRRRLMVRKVRRKMIIRRQQYQQQEMFHPSKLDS